MTQSSSRSAAVAPLVALCAWLVPGLGHAFLRKWGRALAFFTATAGLALCGCAMRGNVFASHATEPFGTLGFLADAGAGAFYFLSRFFAARGPDVSRAMGDCGTRFIASAGIVNVLGVLDSYEIALGRRK